MFVQASVVAFLCTALLSAAVAQSNSTAWETAEYADGQFSVKLPCPPTGYTLGPKNHVGGPVLNSFHLGCLREDQKRFSAVRIQYKKGSPDAPSAKSTFEDIARSEKWRRLEAEIARAQFQDYPVLDISLKKPPQCGVLRYVLAAPDLFLLSVEDLDGQCDSLLDLTAEFFPSLTFEAR